MKIYTKTGDKGFTGLIGGSRVKKDDIRLETYGTIDELNSWIGMIRSFSSKDIDESELVLIQRTLVNISSHLASDKENTREKMPSLDKISSEQTEYLEKAIDKMNAELPKLKHFVLPGGLQIVASCHIARTVCRRAERRIITLSHKTSIDKEIIIFVNRLSDYLFTLARFFSFKQDVVKLF